jgi:hypothetical protein
MTRSKRRGKRVLGIASIIVKKQECALIDISESGVSFVSPQAFDSHLNKTLPFTLRIPDSDIFPGALEMNLSGIVKHCQYLKSKGLYKVGMELDAVEEKKQEFIDYLVDSLKKNNIFWGIDEELN